MARARRFCWLAAAVLGWTSSFDVAPEGMCCFADDSSSPGNVFYQDFRGGQLHPAIALSGPGADRVVTSDRNGLRIRIPKNHHNPRTIIGVSPTFTLGGDFAVTIGYEFLSADVGSVDAGVNLRVLIGSPVKEAAGLARCVREGEGNVFSVTKTATNKNNDDKAQRKSSTVPASACRNS